MVKSSNNMMMMRMTMMKEITILPHKTILLKLKLKHTKLQEVKEITHKVDMVVTKSHILLPVMDKVIWVLQLITVKVLLEHQLVTVKVTWVPQLIMVKEILEQLQLIKLQLLMVMDKEDLQDMVKEDHLVMVKEDNLVI